MIEEVNVPDNRTVGDVLTALEVVAPAHLAFDRDPTGLLVGDPAASVTHLLTTLDVTHSVVEEAKRRGAEMIIAHHPLIYHPLKAVRADNPHPGAIVMECIRSGIAVACAHTCWDVAEGGVNDVLAALLGLSDTRPLRITYGELGIGRVGRLAKPLPAPEFLQHIRTALNFEAVRSVGPQTGIIDVVAVCGGAGAELMPEAIAAGAKAFVTSDIRHHEFVDAEARHFLLIDAGHAATETPGALALGKRLAQALSEL